MAYLTDVGFGFLMPVDSDVVLPDDDFIETVDVDLTLNWSEARTDGSREVLSRYGLSFEAFCRYTGCRYEASLDWYFVESLAARYLWRKEWAAPSETAKAIARTIVEAAAPDRLPILADALEDGGFNVEWVLQWMRKGGERALALLDTVLFSSLTGVTVAEESI
jgi:hypothetical protein